ncbi:PQQ-dependent sugar dehydrogenase [Alteromonas gilva]|uniref:PQQ-dependent sugar dehydrogenase n=1 Tax=Alteromonas gilva TaxID=2987522 RepID=A0ABT5KZ20_9ALTE|nr:PQQ-dependent sugar dehydrogenase [Alteromonas gilva]MDC8830015.1 PQQ-dependent sugar dehydrogenase [Alteromonas gilva]
MLAVKILLLSPVYADVPPVLTGNFHQTQIAGYLTNPWAVVENPLGGWLITERSGIIVEYTHAGERQEIPLEIKDLYVDGQGGLLDIVLSDDFIESRRVYLSYAIGTAQSNYLAFGTTRLIGDNPTVTTLFKVSSGKDTPVHFGGRLLKMPDNSWLLTSGDGFDYREQAQRKQSHLGKVLRFNTDGTPHKDNPFYSAEHTPASYIYTLGHRNPQGLVRDPSTGKIWLNEHGPAGGDEINLLSPGNNYGWPVVTLGEDYSGAQITPFDKYPGMTDPLLNWTPSIAPSSMVVYQDDLFTELNNHLLVSSLKDKALYAVALDQNPMSAVQIFATINERLRDVIVGRDGAIYVLTDGERGRLMRFSPLRDEGVPEHSLR